MCVYNILTFIGYIFIVDFVFILFVKCIITNSNYS